MPSQTHYNAHKTQLVNFDVILKNLTKTFRPFGLVFCSCICWKLLGGGVNYIKNGEAPHFYANLSPEKTGTNYFSLSPHHSLSNEHLQRV